MEREVSDDSTPCLTLGWTWVVGPVEGLPVGLRLRDAEGAFVATRDEAARARVEALEDEIKRLREAAKP